MMSVSKLAFICLVMAVVLKKNRINGVSVKDLTASNMEDDNSEAEKYSVDYNIEGTTKKPNVFQSIADSLGFGQKNPKPQKPSKKPLLGLQNIFKPKAKPAVTSTKTIVLEVTKRVVRHPICFASAIGVQHCGEKHISHAGSHHAPHKISYKESDKETQKNAQEMVEELYEDDFKNEGLYIEPSATMKMPLEPSTAVPEMIDEKLSISRTGRYLKFVQETPAIEDVKSAIEEGEIEDSYESDESDDMGKFLYKKPETKIITSTVWVTRVQKVTDYRVTATLIPKNCIPADFKFPHCPHAQSIPHPLIWKKEGEIEEGKVETSKPDELSNIAE